MKIVVIGGSGLIGSKLVDKFGQHVHDAVAADLKTGVNTLTGEGLGEALASAAAMCPRRLYMLSAEHAPSCERDRVDAWTAAARMPRRRRPRWARIELALAA